MSFSDNYFQARDSFRQIAGKLAMAQTAHAVGGDELTIDVATYSASQSAPTLIISSGLHGPEGFIGSAIQLRLMCNWLNSTLPQNIRIVLVHALNPFGFAHLRRWNESDVDLNRNFMLPGESYSGCHETYRSLDPLLNPKAPPSNWDLFSLRAAGLVLRYGLQNVKQAIAQGQYEYPAGLFYGGNQLQETGVIVEREIGEWVADSSRVVHLDIHSGLGKYGTHKLMVDYPLSRVQRSDLEDTFGDEQLEVSDSASVGYHIKGGLGRWCAMQNSSLNYTYLCAEFGTYGPITMLSRLRTEQQSHRHCIANDPRRSRAKTDLKEAFCPADPVWREAVLHQSETIVEQALQLL